jgi:AcrR family transcriptional regulator
MSRCLDRPMVGRRTPSADVRSALVDAAATVLEREGAAAVTVRAVAAEAGVAPMGVYNHLDGKAGLLLAVLQRAFDGLRDAITPPPEMFGEQRLVESGRGYRRFALANPRTYALMFGPSDPSVDTDALLPHAGPAFQALIDVVIGAQHAGVVRAGEPAELALQIWSAVHGGISLELTQNQHEADSADRAYEQLLEMISRGVAPDRP